MSGAADIGGLWELSPVAVRAVYAFTLAVVISLYGRSKNSLNNTGAVAAVGVGTATFFCKHHTQNLVWSPSALVVSYCVFLFVYCLVHSSRSAFWISVDRFFFAVFENHQI